MHEVTIPLSRSILEVGDSDGVRGDYLKVIHEEYAHRYLDALGIASTPANKALVVKECMLKDYSIQGIWAENGGCVAHSLKITPPLRQRYGHFDELSDVDQHFRQQWYGHAEPICVQPPASPRTGSQLARERTAAALLPDDSAGADAARGGRGQGGTREDLAQELAAGRQERAPPREVGTISAKVGRMDQEKLQRLRGELQSLKSKYILPFACERKPLEPGARTELCPWSVDEPLDLRVPPQFKPQAQQPPTVTLDDVAQKLRKWVDELAPLELLTSRQDSASLRFDDLRGELRDQDVARLTGLLAHLLYWLMLGAQCGDQRLSKSATQSILVVVYELWSKFERQSRESPLGVSFMLPCLMLTLKRGVERSFEQQYPGLMDDEELRQGVIDRINMLFMRLFDHDCLYARFGKFDGTGKGIQLSRRLDLLHMGNGNTHAKRLHSRTHRSTPLVRSLHSDGHVSDARTRKILAQSHLEGAVPSTSMLEVPDAERRNALLKLAMERLSIGGALGTRSARGRSPRNGSKGLTPRTRGLPPLTTR